MLPLLAERGGVRRVLYKPRDAVFDGVLVPLWAPEKPVALSKLTRVKGTSEMGQPAEMSVDLSDDGSTLAPPVGMSPLPSGLEWMRTNPDARVLAVTNMWPDQEQPVYGVFVKRQVDALADRGCPSDVLYVRGYAGKGNYLRAALWFARSAPHLRRRYSLVHAHAGETGLAARCARGLPVVTSFCGDDILGDPGSDGSVPPAGRVRAGIIQQHSRLMTATITKTSEMQGRLPLPQRNLVIPNGVDDREFSPEPMATARERLGWRADESIVLFAATKPHAERKRLALAKAAVACASSMKSSPMRLEIAEDVDPQQMPTLLNGADCLLLTSSVEGSPNIVKEAMMCSVPVVSTDVGDVRELLMDVSPSAVCTPDPEQLGAALVACLGSRSNGREIALARVGQDLIAQRVLDLYAEIAPSTR